MGSLINNITEYYHFVNDELADPRSNPLPFVSSPWPIMITMYLYRKTVHEWGPAFMKDREPYEIKKLLIAYNLAQVLVCGYLTFECLYLLYLPGYYSLWCQKMITETTPLEMKVVHCVWLYYMIKIADLLDTLFFVMRKKFSHVSFLHVYHHLGMCLLGFVGTKYVPGGHGVMLGFINSFVHMVMYAYYLLVALRPEHARWYKKYVTQLQIFQFVLLIFHFGHVLFEPSCEYPKWVSMMFLPHNIFILILFSDYYLKEYVYKKDKKEEKKA